jgi:hypothetical protein
MHGAIDGQAGNVKRLREDVCVHRLSEQQPKRTGQDVGGRQRGFGKIGASAGIVILPISTAPWNSAPAPRTAKSPLEITPAKTSEKLQRHGGRSALHSSIH